MGKLCQVGNCMQRSEAQKMYFWVIHVCLNFRELTHPRPPPSRDSSHPMTNWYRSRRASPSPFDSGHLWRPILACELPVDCLSTLLSLSTLASPHTPFLRHWFQVLTLPSKYSVHQNSISECAYQRTQPAAFSLISFWFQLGSWVLYFLASLLHLLPFSLELATCLLFGVFYHVPLQPFSVGITTRKHPSVTCWILLA